MEGEFNNSFYFSYPLPNLPPRGKELKNRHFPFGGNGKGGKHIKEKS
jgi:hypothetical protein